VSNSLTAPLSVPARPQEAGPAERVGVLLLHGFTSSPAAVRPWGEFLADKGYAVEVPLLPGHGTRWKDLNRTTWRDWYDEAERGFTKLRDENDRVVVGGLCTGAALALLLAAEHGDDVAGVISVNVSVDYLDSRLVLLPFFRWFGGSSPWVTDDIKKPGQSEFGYSRLPHKAAASVFQLFGKVQPALRRVDQPLLLFTSSVDHVRDPKSHEMLLDRVVSEQIHEHVLEDSFHVATLDNDALKVFEESAAFIHGLASQQDPVD
jgi:carboxylesterase